MASKQITHKEFFKRIQEANISIAEFEINNDKALVDVSIIGDGIELTTVVRVYKSWPTNVYYDSTTYCNKCPTVVYGDELFLGKPLVAFRAMVKRGCRLAQIDMRHVLGDKLRGLIDEWFDEHKQELIDSK